MDTIVTGPASKEITKKKFPVVGIGASAGGLDAFKRFLGAVPEDSGMAFVVVQHLDPSHDSILPEILSKVTNIPVHEITDEIKLEPDNIYVIPPNKTLTSTDGILLLTPRDKIHPNIAIDIFFKSLAEVHQNYAVGIVLSGAGKDGTAGLKEIKANGGITFAQDDESSAYKSMPDNAIAAEVVDFVMAPEKIPEQLSQINHTYKQHYLDSEATLSKEEEATMGQILSMLAIRTGVDFSYYKQNTIRRRLARRMAIANKATLGSYLKHLQKNKTELLDLFQDILIPVTSFFRDPKSFDALSDTVFPSLLKNKSINDPIRIWSAACSTGEETYSLAICIYEFLHRESISRQVQVFGSDISEMAIAKARAGIYKKEELKNVSDARLKPYFTKSNGGYQVERQIRDMCVFAVHNLVKDPPFAKLDLISCRNMLIYLEPFLQKKALTTFHYALKSTGFLFLGKSETVGVESDLFSIFSKPDKIYTCNRIQSRVPKDTQVRKDKHIDDAKQARPKLKAQETDFRKSAEALLLSRHTPPSVVVNDRMEIVNIYGTITPFLQPSQGKPTFNVIKMARGNLGFELRNAVHKCKESNKTFVKELIPIENGEKPYSVTIEVSPLTDLVDPHFLIVFRKVPVTVFAKPLPPGIEDPRIRELQRELIEAQENMLAITQEQESSNDELQTANEELLSGSEELQSLNEELETTKEEVQSTNEELVVVNQELLEKQDQLNKSRLYSEAIIQTIREPLVILDKELRIRTANASFYKKFSLIEKETEGRFFYEIAQGIWDIPLLRSMLENLLPKKSRLDDYEIVLNLPQSGETSLQLNARQVINETTDEEFILLALVDVTEKKYSEQRQKEISEELEVKVKERTETLEQANFQLEQFSHTASHEFQEPLRKIVTFASHLRESYSSELSEDVKMHLNKIETASVRMRKLIEDMLDYASVTAQSQQFQKTDLNKIFGNVLFDFELLILEKKATVTSDALPTIAAIPFQMNQLFYDLIYNALKFSKQGVPSVIHLSSRKLAKSELPEFRNLDKNLDYYKLILKDNGIGFDQKYAGKIFTMFQRLNEAHKYPGTGIGLALCYKIVRSHHGSIYAEGKENSGAEFHIILPVKQPK